MYGMHQFPDQVSRLSDLPTGYDLLHHPWFSKGTAFTEEERDLLNLRGLLPPIVSTIEGQTQRAINNIRKKSTNLEKYIFLVTLQERNETLFYRLLMDHLEELMPIIYTPTVGQACSEYLHIFRRPMGLQLSKRDKGRFKQILQNWPRKDVRVIVVTDGERILGLGDLGLGGIGIPVGKMALYTALAGIHPGHNLPIIIDVGTNNPRLLNEPLYLGLKEERIRGQEYDDLIDEFVWAVQEVYPKALIQFEDFANLNAFRLLEAYEDRISCFNDDIQGTASVAVAGVFAALKETRTRLADHRILFLGAGEAATGIGHLIVDALKEDGMPEPEAKTHCWFVDSKGLVVTGREGIGGHKAFFAHTGEFTADLLTAIRLLKPTILIGASGQGGSFTREVIEAMAAINDRPVIFALSNPTSHAECTAEQAYGWSGGRAIFASGSPFDPVTIDGKTRYPGQGNNAYIFPAVGLAAVVTAASRIPNETFLIAAHALSELVTDQERSEGRLYPTLTRIREVSFHIALAVTRFLFRKRLARVKEPADPESWLRTFIYEPRYPDYTRLPR